MTHTAGRYHVLPQHLLDEFIIWRSLHCPGLHHVQVHHRLMVKVIGDSDGGATTGERGGVEIQHSTFIYMLCLRHKTLAQNAQL